MPRSCHVPGVLWLCLKATDDDWNGLSTDKLRSFTKNICLRGETTGSTPQTNGVLQVENAALER
jgi:hypothetical protein